MTNNATVTNPLTERICRKHKSVITWPVHWPNICPLCNAPGQIKQAGGKAQAVKRIINAVRQI